MLDVTMVKRDTWYGNQLYLFCSHYDWMHLMYSPLSLILQCQLHHSTSLRPRPPYYVCTECIKMYIIHIAVTTTLSTTTFACRHTVGYYSTSLSVRLSCVIHSAESDSELSIPQLSLILNFACSINSLQLSLLLVSLTLRSLPHCWV
jgi:hypothetical protein